MDDVERTGAAQDQQQPERIDEVARPDLAAHRRRDEAQAAQARQVVEKNLLRPVRRVDDGDFMTGCDPASIARSTTTRLLPALADSMM